MAAEGGLLEGGFGRDGGRGGGPLGLEGGRGGGAFRSVELLATFGMETFLTASTESLLIDLDGEGRDGDGTAMLLLLLDMDPFRLLDSSCCELFEKEGREAGRAGGGAPLFLSGEVF